jgi:hypothetical protein
MAMVDWSSLPSDLIRRVADGFLATSDLDYYMSLRAVCHNWRAATDDPRGPDPRFRPRGWVMLLSLAWEEVGRPDDPTPPRPNVDSGCRLFLNVDTGRVLWKDMPLLLNKYRWVAADANGLLLLSDKTDNGKMCVLNPFTGHLFHFGADWPSFGRTLLAADTSTTMVLYAFFNSRNGSYGMRFDPTRDLDWWPMYSDPDIEEFTTMVAFQGCAYGGDIKGSVITVAERCVRDKEYPDFATIVSGDWETNHRAFLVDNDGELLLVRISTFEGGVQAFRIDLERKALEEIKGIGKRAIFLGKGRSLSVNADNLPTVESNCVYYVGGGSQEAGNHGIGVHRVVDGSSEELFENVRVKGRIFVEAECRARPLSLAQVLLDDAKCYN